MFDTLLYLTQDELQDESNLITCAIIQGLIDKLLGRKVTHATVRTLSKCKHVLKCGCV